jgi:RHS repeat-associated protein
MHRAAANYRFVIFAVLTTAIAGFAIRAWRPADSLRVAVQAEECVCSHGYWKDHRSWPVPSLVLGDAANPAHSYSQADLLRLGSQSGRPDASLILGYQLIAAKLNIANGSNAAPIAAQLAAADRLLAGFRTRLPYGVPSNTALGQNLVAIAAVLDDYNNGRIPNSCGHPRNSPPVAKAGPDQTVAAGATVHLSGAASSDPNGDRLTFAWSFVSKPPRSYAVLSRATSITPTFVADVAGSYVVQLIVRDGQVSSAPDTVRISTGNSRPVANAGRDQSLPVQSVAHLDGRASSDADGDVLGFSWSFVSRPAGSVATLANPAAVAPTFVIDRPGAYVVQLIVSDRALSSAADTVTISTTNSAPRANAGPDVTAALASTVSLSGSGSTDADGDTLTYHWSLVARPDSSQTALQNPGTVNPTIVVDVPGSYVVQLIVNDQHVDSAADTLTISTTNTRPVANAGADASAFVGDIVRLDGSGSTDLDGDPIAYRWSLTTRPAGSAAVLSDPAAVAPSFTVDVTGDYIAQLIATDGALDSAPDTVTISSRSRNRPPIADPGGAQTVALGSIVQLDGSGSSDPDGNALTFRWSLLSAPPASAASLSNAASATPIFVADRTGSYVAQLVVNDGALDSAATTVTISTQNTAPTANAGPDRKVATGLAAALDGSGSADPDGSPLEYSWSLLTRPAGSAAAISSPTTATSTLVPDVDGVYVAQLIVSDGTLAGAPDTVMLTAQKPADLQIAFSELPTHRVVGATETIAMNVVNNGPNAASGVTASFRLPDGYAAINFGTQGGTYDAATGVWAIESLSNGQGVRLAVNATILAGGTHDLTATITGSSAPDPVPANNTVTVPIAVNNDADLQIIFSELPTHRVIDANEIIAINVVNNGPSAASGVTATFRLPDGYTPRFFGTQGGTYDAATGVWDIGSLGNGQGVRLGINATVRATGTYDLTTAIAGSSAPDPVPANNTAAASIAINADADLSVDFAAAPSGTIVPGTQLTVFLHATDKGPSPSGADLKVHFKLPPGFTPNGQIGVSVGTYDAATGVWDIGPVAVNTNANLIGVVVVNATGSTELTGTIISGTEHDPNLANNAVTAPHINRRPIANAGPDQTVATNALVALNGLQTFDPEGDPFTYQWTFAQKPANSTATIASPTSATPSFVTDLGGNYIASLIATDNSGASSLADTVVISATAFNHAPVVRSKPNTIAAVGEAYRYAVRATDPDAGDVLTFSLPVAPQGMTVDPSSGIVDWTPAAGQGGVQTATIRVTDHGGLFALQSFAIQTSSQANHAPIANPDSYSVRLGDALSVVAPGVLRNDLDADGHPLTTRLVTPPANGTLGFNADGSFSYSPFTLRRDEFVLAENVSLTRRVPGVTVSASSSAEFGGDCPKPQCVIDDSEATSWLSNDSSPFIEVTFPQDVTVAHVQVQSDRESGGSRKVTAGIIELRGADGGLLFSSGNVELPLPLHDVTVDVPNIAAVRRVRFVITTTTDGFLFRTGVAELHVIGSTLLRRQPQIEPNLSQLLPTAVHASSTVPDNPPESVLDDAFYTNWYAASAAAGEFIELTFPVAATVSQIQALNASSRPDFFGTSLQLHCSGAFELFDAQGVSLFNSGIVATPTGGIGSPNPFLVSVPNVAGVRRVRYTTSDCTGSPFPPGFAELRVIGAAATDRPALSLAKKLQALGGREVHSTPVVVNLTDDNGDGKIDVHDIPDIVVPVENATNQLTGDLEIISGDDGRVLMTLGVGLVSPWSEVAAGDLDGDGVPEIIAVHSDGNHLIAFDHTGATKWISDANAMPRFLIGNAALIGGAISIANLDHAGAPEIVVGSSVFDANGHLLGDGRTLGGTTAGIGLRSAISAVADVDLDGVPEIIAGPTAYRLVNGVLSKVWQRTDRADGYVGVANFDEDPQAEIVSVANGAVYMLNHDGSDAEVWNGPTHAPVPLPGGGQGGAPLIVDVDGDGVPEIGIAGATRYTLFNRDGSVRWASAVTDRSSNSTGAVAFDLDGDGAVEIIYRDEQFLRVFRGGDGVLLAKFAVGSSTWSEEPVVVDVDNDGHADIVVSSDFFTQSIGPADTGIFVLQDVANKWTRTRRIWNESAYHVTNVNEDGTIPLSETPHWLASGLNAFRINQFMPGETPDATDSFTYAASDGTLESTATVRIAVRTPNGPPTFISSPIEHGAGNVAYVYAVQAADPDAGDILTFSLPTAPAGMTIDPATGLITWTPTAGQAGTHDVVVKVRDVHGLLAVQGYTVTVGSAIAVPDVVGQLQTSASSAITAATLTVGAISTRNSPTAPVNSVISQAPAGGTLVAPAAPISLIVSTGPAPAGTVPDIVGQTQARAQADIVAAGFVVGAVAGQNSAAATVGVVLAQTPTGGGHAPSGSAVNLVVSLGPPPDTLDLDHDGFTGKLGDCNDTNPAIHPGAFDIPGDGIDQDCNGRDAIAGDVTPPSASLLAPAENAEITIPTDIIGTATDANFLRYTLQLVRADSNDAVTLASGAGPVAGGTLGRVDPTLLENGIYRLRLIAEDVNGQTVTVERAIVVEGAVKIGNFRVSFKDLAIPVAGTPITVFRTYDSRVKTREDFGIGWTLDIARGTYEHSRTPGEAWQILPGGSNLPCRTVSEAASHLTQVRLSDYEFYTFALTLSDPRPLSGGCEATASFRTVGGRRVGATLEIMDGTDLLYLNGDSQVVYPDTFTIYNPQRVRLTTADGRIFELERQKGITRVQDASGNTLTITPAGIIHSSGKSISFVRDAQGRIVRIVDPIGSTLTYAYDNRGDLTSVVDRAGLETTFTYDDRHDLLQIIDPAGRTGLRSEYDADGRLIATEDGAGHRTTLAHDIGARTETVTDRRGSASVIEYDQRGNVVRRTDPLGHTTGATYDSRDNKLSETDELGRVSSYTYDAADNLTSQTDPLGNTVSFVYNASNRVTAATDPRGAQTTFQYDSRGNLTEQRDSLGRVIRGTYDSHGLLTTVANGLGVLMTNERDASGQVIGQTDGLGNVSSFTYDGNGRQISQTYVLSKGAGSTSVATTAFQLDGRDQLREVVDPTGASTRMSYDVMGHLTTTTDHLGVTTQYDYDVQGNRIRTTRTDGASEEIAYDENGNQIRRTDPAGRTARFEYDAMDRLVRVVHADGSEARNLYDAAGQLVSAIDENGAQTSFEYDEAKRRTKVTDAAGGVRRFAYDEIGHLIAETDPNGRVTRYEYNAAGQRTKAVYPDGAAATMTYDAVGNVSTTTDQEGRTTRYEFDLLGRLNRVTDALGHVTSYGFNERGDMTSQTDPNGHVTRWEYDGSRRVVGRTLPLGMRESFSYNGNGQLLGRTDFNGHAASFAYDQNQLTGATYPDASGARFVYGPDGRRQSMTDATGTTTYAYDARGQLSHVVAPDGATISYGFDAVGNLTTLASPSGVVRYTYDAANRLSSVIDPDQGVTRYTYDSAGNTTAAAYPNGVTAQYDYDTRNQITAMVYRDAHGTELSRLAYTYSPTGRRLSETAGNGRRVDYGYDALYRLSQERVTDAALGNSTLTYTYDAVGNRLSRTGPGGVLVYAYDPNDRMIAAGPTTFSHDANGNVVAKTAAGITTTYGYDDRNHLRSAAGGGPTSSYVYDGDGVRVGATVNGVETRYLQNRLGAVPTVLEERNASGGLLASYVRGGGLISQARGADRSFYLPDALGSTRALVDRAGAVTDTFTFDAFGNLQARTGNTANDNLFVGEQFDAGTGLYFLRARSYDPFAGRFTGSDPVPPTAGDPRTLHRYAYCASDPLNCIDPTGRESMMSVSTAASIAGVLSGIAIVSQVGLTAQVLTLHSPAEYVGVAGRSADLYGESLAVSAAPMAFESPGLPAKVIALGLAPFAGVDAVDVLHPYRYPEAFWIYPYFGVSISVTNWLPPNLVGSLTGSPASISAYVGYAYQVDGANNYLGHFLSVAVSKLIGRLEGFGGLPANGAVFSDPSGGAGSFGWSVGLSSSTSLSLSAGYSYYPTVFEFVPENIGRRISQSEVLQFAKYALSPGMLDWR